MSAASPKYRLERDDLVRIANVPYRPISPSASGYLMVRNDLSGGLTEEITHEDLAKFARRGDLQHERGHFAPAQGANRPRSPEAMMRGASDEDLEQARLRECYVQAFLTLEARRAIKRTDASMNAGRNVLIALANDIYSDGRVPERRNAGKKVSQVGCPSPRALRTWIKNYERDGIAGLRDNRSRSGKKGTDFLKVEVDMLHEAAREYASSQRPSKKMIHQRLAARIRDENRSRGESGERLLRTPSRSTLERAIRKVDPLLVYAGRYGEDAALRYARTVGSGLTHLRPLQRVEIDECEMDLMVILALSGAFRALPDEERERMGLTGEKVRVWVTVAIDCATRCILAMKISLNPSQHSALEALRMVIEDKSVWADAVGALSAWFMCGRPEEICSDNGSAFLSWSFRTAAEDLGIRVTRTVAKVPQMRGTIESIFSTIAQDLIARLTGRTFGSILERGDHPSEANAALTLDDLAFALVRWVVDIYHRRPHSGLDGRSPAQMWEALTEEHHILPPPSARQMRIAFGVEVERKLAKDGIRVMNVRYHDVALAQRFVRNIGKPYKVRLDPTNLGAIEILDEGAWRELKAVDSRFEGVSATDWARAAAASRRARARTEEEAAEVIWAAYSAIDQTNTKARLVRGLIEDKWDADRLARVEGRLTAFIRFREDPDVPSNDPLAMGIPTGAGEQQPTLRRNPRERGSIGSIEKED